MQSSDVSNEPPPSAVEPPHQSSPEPSSTKLPLLPRLLDIVTIVFGLVAITVLFTGGFREWTPFGRISLTSWLRPALWSMAAFLVRSWWWPRERLFTRISHGIRRWAKDDVMALLPIYLTSRAGVLIVGFFAVAMIGWADPTAGPPFRIYANEFLNLPARHDAGWYFGIASQGYDWDPAGRTGQQSIVFFPLLPMLMRYGSLLFGRQMLWTGMAVSLGAFLWGLIYLYRFAREELGADRALATATLLCAYPFAVFYSAPYTESLFLLTSVAACYHFRREELWQAGAWGVLCGLTRPNGCLLSIVLALMAVGPLWRGSWRLATPPQGWLRFADRIAIAATPGIGMIIFSIFIYYLTGDPLQWSKQQIGWGRVYYPLERLVIDQIERIDTHGMYGYSMGWTIEFMYLFAVMLVLISVVPVYRRFGLPLATLLVINIFPPLMMGGLLSMGRTTSVLFPTFMWLGAVVPPSHRSAWVMGFAVLQGLCAVMFFTWRPIF